MKTRNVVAIGFAALILGAAAVFYRSLVPPESPSGSLAFLSSAKTLPIYDREGKVTDLAGQKGKLLIVHFWATWCPPCVEEIPALSQFWDRYKNRSDLALYAISVISAAGDGRHPGFLATAAMIRLTISSSLAYGDFSAGRTVMGISSMR